MKLSIITINYNNASGLKKTVESIVSHPSAEVEYIVIDGASTDGSLDVIQEYQDKISYWVSEPDSGIYNAMNKGIKQATGEYILFVNSGDSIRDDADIQKVLAHITGEDIVYFNLEIAGSTTGNSYIKKYPPQPDFKYFMEDTLPHTASFIKKKQLEEYGYYSESMRIASDWAFFTDSVCLNNCSCKYIDDCFSTFYIDGISSQSENRKLLLAERDAHVRARYSLYYSLYKERFDKKEELYKLKVSTSVRYLKKLGFLKWLKL
jgi:glycosyltransferase involved in cell wall biosynthesis